MKLLFSLAISFFKVGLFTFGGGYAMLPLLEREVVCRRGWVSGEELADYYAIGQCTPGIIAVNAATFVGYKCKGVLGGIFATLGLVLPSMLVIGIIATVLEAFAEVQMVKNAFAGIRICVCVLVLNAAVKFWKATVKGKFTFVIFTAVFLGATFLDISPAIYVVFAAVCGLVFGSVKDGGK